MVEATQVEHGIPQIKSIDEEIAELVAIIREANERLDEVSSETRPLINAAKDRLQMLLEHRGDNWSDGDGYARLVSEGTRIMYDATALDELILENPERYGWLREYRQEVPVSGGVRVK